MGFLGGSVVIYIYIYINPSANARDSRNAGSIPGSKRSPGVGNGNPLQYSCLENSMDRGAWQATVQEVAKNQTYIYSHQDIYLLAQREKYRSMEQNRKPRDKFTHLWTPYL